MTAAVLVLFTLSGACALVDQLVWTRWLGLIVGNFAYAAATVVTVFMAGLAAGNWLLGEAVRRRSPAASLTLYAWLETGLGLYAAVLPFVLASSSPAYGWLGAATAGPAGRALLCAALLLPPTLLMGGTLPALVRALRASAPAALGPLYALNTLGGAAGPLIAAFWLMPAFGMRTTAWCAAAVNLAVGATAAFLAARAAPRFGPVEPVAPAPDAADGPPGGRATPYLLAAASGFLALGFEIALTRYFILTVTGGSVYGFASILSAFLVGLAAGAFLVRRWPPASPASAYRRFALCQVIAWAFALTTPFWDGVPLLLLGVWARPLPFAALAAFDYACVLALVLVFTTASGYALPALAGAVEGGAPAIGRLFAANTAGAVLGAPVTAFLLLRVPLSETQTLGLNGSLLVLGGGALLVAGAAAVTWLPPARRPWLLGLVVPAALPLLLLPPPDASLMNAGIYNRPAGFEEDETGRASTPAESAHRLGRIVYENDSLTARIAIRRISDMEMSFVVNGKPDGSTSLVDMYTQIFMAHLPALMSAHPARVLVIGCGTGTTTGCLALHRDVETIDLAEIEPAQIDVARWFQNHNYGAMDNPKVHLHLDDARHFLLTSADRWDVIVSEPSNLWVSGMVNLFTREFYESVAAHLNPGGVFFQWIHYYRVSPADVKGMAATFRSVFPQSSLWIHQFGDAFLMARDGGVAVDPDEWRRRMDEPQLVSDLRRIQLAPRDLLGFFLYGPEDLRRWTGDAQPCTDDRPYLEFTTPRVRYDSGQTNAIQLAMQLYAPVDPMPLVRETAARRDALAAQFYARGSLARARAEWRRALTLDPGLASARQGLRHLEEILQRGPAPQAGGPESFTR